MRPTGPLRGRTLAGVPGALALATLACTLGTAPATQLPAGMGVAPLSALTAPAAATALAAATATATTATAAPRPATQTATAQPSPTRPAPADTPSAQPSPPSETPTTTATPSGGAAGFLYHSGLVTGTKTIWLWPQAAETPRALTEGVSPALSPDGRWLAFTSDRTGNLEVFVLDLTAPAGTEARNLTQHPANDDSPAWRADGQLIVFSSGRDGNAELYAMRPDGTDLVRLTNTVDRAEIQPAFAPDGRLAYAALQDGVTRLYVREVDGRIQALAEGPGQSKFPAWSPDGRLIAFASDRERAGVFELYELTVAEGTVRQLTNSGTQNGSPHYAPDGRLLIFDSNRDGNYDVYRLTLETLGVTPLTRSERPQFNGDPVWLAGAAR